MKSNCANETEDFGRVLGASLKPGAIVALTGDLGAGKTTLIKGIIATLSGDEPRVITSPTFNYVSSYGDGIHHFDLYRLKDSTDFIARGFQDYFTDSSICCIEWPEKIDSLLPPHTLFLNISYTGPSSRTITTRVKEPL
jgi:tRNA threonylcarbamoyladenosine biosynthesis protein TsaE